MTDDRGRMTRRGLLALTVSAGVAGCSALPPSGDSSTPRIDGSRLAEIAAGDVPTVPQTVPVAIADDHLQSHIDRTRSLLSQAPLPFDERELPNGAMRQQMNDTADAARTILEGVGTEPSAFEAVSALRDARGKARAVAAAWAYAEDGLRREDLVDDTNALTADIDAFRESWSYVGDDPVRALLVHGTIEELVRTATTNAGGRPENPRVARKPESLITVSEYAADLERGRAALEYGTHLYDRLRTDLTTTHDLAETFDAGLDKLFDTLQTTTADFDRQSAATTYIDADVEQSPVRYPLEYLYSDLTNAGPIIDHRDRGEVASALLQTHRELTRLRAFEDLRERVEDGETYVIENAGDLVGVRDTAVTEIETALRETASPDLSRKVLHNVTELIESVDRELTGYDASDQIPVDNIRREAGEYIYVGAVARATPGVSSTVAATLEN